MKYYLLPFGFALAFALAGCGGPPPVAPSGGGPTTSGQAVQTQEVKEPASLPGKYGGTLRTSQVDDPKTFNLWCSGETSSGDVIGPLYEPLNDRNPYTLKFEPHLAELPKISSDGLTYTYTLKDGLKWSDNAPITTDDVIFTLDVLFDPKIETIMREGMMMDSPQPDGTIKRVPFKYRKVDARTVEFQLPKKFAPAEAVFSFPIAPKHKLEAAYRSGTFNSTWNVNTDPKELVSSGPWIISEYVARQRLIYKRNPNFWRKSVDGKPLPYLDEWDVVIVPDVNTAQLKFQNGDTDLVGIQARNYPQFKEQASQKEYKVIDRGPGWGFSYVAFNLDPASPVDKDLQALFADTRFRQAVSYCTNRKRMCDDIFIGLAKPLYTPVSPADRTYFDPNAPKFEYDLDKARKLLAEIGLKDKDAGGILQFRGKPVKFNIYAASGSDPAKKMLEILTNDLKTVGVDAQFTAIDFNELVRRISTEPYDWEAQMLGFTGGPEPYDGSNIWRSSGPSHVWWPKEKKPATPWEAKIDKLWSEGAEELDPKKRKKIYDEWQTIIGEQQPLIFTVVPDQLTAVRSWIGNFKETSFRLADWNNYEFFDTRATRAQP